MCQQGKIERLVQFFVIEFKGRDLIFVGTRGGSLLGCRQLFVKLTRAVAITFGFLSVDAISLRSLHSATEPRHERAGSVGSGPQHQEAKQQRDVCSEN